MPKDSEQRRLEDRWLSSTTRKKREEKEKMYGKWCSNKDRYPTESEAMEAQQNSFKMTGKILAIYRCQKCDGFHLTKRTDRN